ncbi:DUF6331 family protein [Rhodocytophaga aerolata]|uniref:DUF6331 family protein n=1 Tax=Rhodocytophaga aerolata TaxID=455078 RepID=A0ABT8R817_9BACT|nr:DUF6331 family protein [Rhodocytophaga aerolata]MDO1448246.1 DUF6331 family protein [Rhodocytophaga aerolata]
MGHINNISISQDVWIEWIDFDQKNASELEIDPFLNSTDKLWKNLETDCIAACCGINAFNFWPDNIQKATRELDKGSLLRNLVNTRSSILAAKEEVISSNKLNILFHKRVFLTLLDHIIKNIDK